MTDYVDMQGWTITARRFRAWLRDGFHYFGAYAHEISDRTYVGPCNSAEEVWQEIGEIIQEVRPEIGRLPDELERASIIALARRLDPATLDAEACAAGPGRYEGAQDLALVVALDTLSHHGCADDQAGNTEYGSHLARFGRRVLETDSRGFVTAEIYSTEEKAQAELDAENARYSEEEN